MKKTITAKFRAVRRINYIVVAMLLFVGTSPVLFLGKSAAATYQLASRSVQLSDSAPSGTSIINGVGSGTNVTYKFTFSAYSTASSMVIDFCDNTPIIGDSCNAPNGMSVTGAALANDATTPDTNITAATWTLAKSNSPNPRLQLSVGTGTPMLGNATTPVQHVFDITGITNPATVGTAPVKAVGSYYARIYTFSNTTYGSYTNAAAAASSGFSDYGGAAISTAQLITIQARVQESLTFCVTAADPDTWTTTDDCGDTQVTTNPPALILGHGTPTAVLDSNTVDYQNAWTQLSTNATHGAVINMRNSNLTCGGLSANYNPVANTGTCAIPAVGTPAGANTGPFAITAGTAAFGVAINSYTPPDRTPGTIGALTPTSPYYNAAHYTYGSGATRNQPSDVYYGMDNTTAAAFNSGQTAYTGSVTSTFGSTVATTATPVYRADDRYTFAATSALTTPAGIYTANLSLIATGTF